jgi:ubiquinol-cytochrome c reductase iron-sulfur subunit
MAAFQAVKKAVNLAPTVRILPTGVPVAPLLNFAARAPSSGHDHAHEASGPRADIQPRWAGGLSQSSSGLVSRTFVNGEYHFFRAI